MILNCNFAISAHNREGDVCLLRIWHAFNAEKLQNIDGVNGNDLLPMPNFQQKYKSQIFDYTDSKWKFIESQLNYVDKLMEAAKIAPTVLLYGGDNLSKKQETMFEALHEKAKAKGGVLLCLNYKELAIENDVKKTLNDIQEIRGKLTKANIIDIERMYILAKKEDLFKKINAKYKSSYNFQGIFYSDFDSKTFVEDLNVIHNNIESESEISAIRFPMTIIPKKNDNYIQVRVEINNIFCLRHTDVMNEIAILGAPGTNYKADFPSFYLLILSFTAQYLSDKLSHQKFDIFIDRDQLQRSIAVGIRSNDDIDILQLQRKVAKALEPLILSGFYSSIDRTWEEDIPSLMLSKKQKFINFTQFLLEQAAFASQKYMNKLLHNSRYKQYTS